MARKCPECGSENIWMEGCVHVVFNPNTKVSELDPETGIQPGSAHADGHLGADKYPALVGGDGYTFTVCRDCGANNGYTEEPWW